MQFEEEQLAARLGEVIGGRWRLRGLLGVGGMAAVYSAEDSEGNRAAIKLLHREMSLRRDIRERFLREASAATAVNHPGAVAIIDQGTTGDSIYLAMELLEGESLAAQVRREGQLAVPLVLSILDQVLDVLASAHVRGVVHRDLKPENLFMTQDQRVKVLDFGLARLLDAAPRDFRTRTGTALGTLPYMAPEQALGRREEIDARTDLFAVGATAFRLLSGRRIHDAASEAELLMAMASKQAPSLLEVAPHLPSQVALIVDRALRFEKAARYPDATCMQRDVREVALGHGPPFALTRLSAESDVTRVEAAIPSQSEVAPPRSQTSTAPLLVTHVAPPASAAPVSAAPPVPPPSTVRTEVMTAFAPPEPAIVSDTASMPPSQAGAPSPFLCPPPAAGAVELPPVAVTVSEHEALVAPPATLRAQVLPSPSTELHGFQVGPGRGGMLGGVSAQSLPLAAAPPAPLRRGLLVALLVTLLVGGAAAAAAVVLAVDKPVKERVSPAAVAPQVIPITVPNLVASGAGETPLVSAGSALAATSPATQPISSAGGVAEQRKKTEPAPASAVVAGLDQSPAGVGSSTTPVGGGAGGSTPFGALGADPVPSSTVSATASPVVLPANTASGISGAVPDSSAMVPVVSAVSASPAASAAGTVRPGRRGKKRSSEPHLDSERPR